ncbi:MAG TPA: aldehyde dehydrogenase PuuC, partial [Pseudomonas sp.]|nr:aldehyde dehydrogenase PuuC [Pseudomonas sp.]
MAGAVVDHQHLQSVLAHIAGAQKQGATLRSGGRQMRVESGGAYVEPALFDEVDNAMGIAREEVFGPVLSVIAFDTLEQAIEIANDSPYGLA